jgi:23S rRNA (uridine2552-2'-O)-methyltransferase
MGKSSGRWIERQRRDPYVKQAKLEDKRSRAVYKLEEIDRQDRLFLPGMTVVDLGAAPGSWSEYALDRVGANGKVVAVDLLDIEPIDNLLFIKGDFTDVEIMDKCQQLLVTEGVDLVISDIAPNLSGIKSADQARSMHVAECVLEFSKEVLNQGGTLLIKMFQGQGVDVYKKEFSERFQKVIVRKPSASREKSSEFYLLGKGFR